MERGEGKGRSDNWMEILVVPVGFQGRSMFIASNHQKKTNIFQT
jgi:hypothetical protein